VFFIRSGLTREVLLYTQREKLSKPLHEIWPDKRGVLSLVRPLLIKNTPLIRPDFM
jgi:hypothetical protein